MNKLLLSARLCRYSARTLSLLILGIILFIAIGEGMPLPRLTRNLIHHPLSAESLGLVGFFFLVAGLFALWRWELAGGLLTLFGLATLFWPTLVNGRVTWFFLAMALPALLAIASHVLRLRAGRLAAPDGGAAEAAPTSGRASG